MRFYSNQPILSSTKATCHVSRLAGFALRQLLISKNPLDRHAECFDVSDPGRMWDSYVDEYADSFDFSQTVGKFESRSGPRRHDFVCRSARSLIDNPVTNTAVPNYLIKFVLRVFAVSAGVSLLATVNFTSIYHIFSQFSTPGIAYFTAGISATFGVLALLDAVALMELITEYGSTSWVHLFIGVAYVDVSGISAACLFGAIAHGW
jgi:hypothetical protein